MNPAVKYLLLGLSTRALAESAVKCGIDVTSLDYFGDRDQKAIVENISLARDRHLPFSAQNLLVEGLGLAFDRVVYTSNLENHPELVEELEKVSIIVGNSAKTLEQVRNWGLLRNFCRDNGISCPKTLLPGEEDRAIKDIDWLVKPVNGGGGRGILPWDKNSLDHDSILQQRIPGVSASAVFAANGEKGTVLGLTRQLIGCEKLGAKGYGWCGNIFPLDINDGLKRSLVGQIGTMLDLFVSKFRLKGVGSMDFILSRGLGFFLEVNPRYTASMELIEKGMDLNIFDIHLKACDGILPEIDILKQGKGRFYGKAIAFARKEIQVQETENWHGMGRRDIPFSKDRIEKGAPVCTLMTSNDTHEECLASLFRKGRALEKELGI